MTDLQLLSDVTDLFKELDWRADSDLYERFVSLLAAVGEAERKLIVTITKDFLNCSLGMYDTALAAMAGRLDPLLAGADPVVLLPLSRERDAGAIKSGAMAAYLLRGHIGRLCRRTGAHFAAFDRVPLIAERMPAREHARVVITDDFIGSGDTAVEALKWFWRAFRVQSDSVVVATLVIQEAAIERLLTSGYSVSVAYGFARTRGISDSTRVQDRAAALAIMDDLERRLGVSADYRRGYKQCEALVSMVRCPNNTFPVYWRDKDPSGRAWPAPFQR